MDVPGRPVSRLSRQIHSLAGSAWPGAAVGSALVAFLLAVDTVIRARVGLGRAAEVVLAVVVAALALALLGAAAVLARAVLHRCPAPLVAGVVGAFGLLFAVFYLLDSGVASSVRLGGTLVLLGAGLGAGVALVAGRPDTNAPGRRAVAWTWLAVSLGAWVALISWLAIPGGEPPGSVVDPTRVPALAAPDPSLRGPHVVRTLIYGSGTDRRRPEYGERVALRTVPVDGSRLVRNLTGAKARVREWFWGFGVSRLPLNGRVWYPEGAGPFPLVLLVHGNHQMEDFVDGGYAYLAEMLASRGVIAVSVDENFLNRSWSGDIGHEQGVRGWLLLQHLAAWRAWNRTPGHPFHRRVDMERIALVGHSRGGEAVTHAAAFNRLPCLPDDCGVRFDFRFSIRALVALAPTDGGYLPADQPVPVGDVSYLVVHGTHDADVANFQGLRTFKRATFTGGAYRFKAAVHVHGANHNQFNTVLGVSDLRGPFRGFALTRSLLDGEDQRRVIRVLVSGFLEATLNGRSEYVAMFRDLRAAAGWLPATIYRTQFEDSTYQLITDFSAGLDLGRGTLPESLQAGRHLTAWRAGQFRGRGNWPFGVRVLYLGWGAGGEPASYRITLPDGAAATWRLEPASRLSLTVADVREAPAERPLDFTLEVATADGAVGRVPLSAIRPLPPVPRVRFTKWAYLDRQFFRGEAEPVLQTYEIPLATFASPDVQPSRIREIRFVFDRTPSGTIALSTVGFASPARP